MRRDRLEAVPEQTRSLSIAVGQYPIDQRDKHHGSQVLNGSTMTLPGNCIRYGCQRE